jgi:hypothetical protein
MAIDPSATTIYAQLATLRAVEAVDILQHPDTDVDFVGHNFRLCGITFRACYKVTHFEKL